jgi:hypothetical protein
VFLFPHILEHLLFALLKIALLTGVRWNLKVALIGISFMTKDAEHFFIVNWAFVLFLLKIVCSFAHLFSGEPFYIVGRNIN